MISNTFYKIKIIIKLMNNALMQLMSKMKINSPSNIKKLTKNDLMLAGFCPATSNWILSTLQNHNNQQYSAQKCAMQGPNSPVKSKSKKILRPKGGVQKRSTNRSKVDAMLAHAGKKQKIRKAAADLAKLLNNTAL
jgi:hypothetical protein